MPNTNFLPLRPYQQRAKEQIHTEWEQGRLRTLLVLPTGTGKPLCLLPWPKTRCAPGTGC